MTGFLPAYAERRIAGVAGEVENHGIRPRFRTLFPIPPESVRGRSGETGKVKIQFAGEVTRRRAKVLVLPAGSAKVISVAVFEVAATGAHGMVTPRSSDTSIA